ncbi:MAG: helix-turn-helix domain-containing protein, partial [Gemmobacter sp.]
MPLTALTGTRIRQRRSLIGLQQAELARAAGISASYLNLIEHNRRKVAGGVLTRIAGALGVDAAALTGGAEATLLDDLREAASAAVWGGAAAPAGGTRPEIDRIEDFVSRFPGWAALVVAQVRRIAQLDRAVEALSDRMSHDPHLSAALHEVLSAVAAVRSTATILTDTPNLEPVWRSRFERNLAADSARLAHGAEALVAYLDAVSEQDSAIAAPLEEREAWLAARGWTLPEPETGEAALPEAPELASAAARSLAADWIATAQRDAAALPLSRLGAHLAGAGAGAGPDPGAIARA